MTSSMKGQFPLDIHSSIEKPPFKPAYLNGIPFDLKDKILELIDTPRHLLSMALVNKDWAALVIPNHIEYRILYTHLNRGYLWDHLAIRADVAKNIRRIRFRKDGEDEIYPVTLCPVPKNYQNIASTGMKIIGAFQNFKSLESLTWPAGLCFYKPTLPKRIFGSLLQFQNLEELRLGQIVGELELADVEPLWKLPNIKRLVLLGNIWAKCICHTEDAFIIFLDNLPELKELSISYNPISPVFTSCALPKLTKLHLWPEYTTAQPGQNILSSDAIMLHFLESHPTIEDLRWYPIGQGLPLSQGLLPALKRILTADHIVKTLLRDSSVIPEREMQVISQISLGPNTMKLLQNMNGAHLQELHIWRFEDLDQIKLLATLFPNIRTVDIPYFVRADRDTIDDCIDTLARFQYLEHFLDSSLWVAVNLAVPTALLQKTVNKLAVACPHLKTLKHWKQINGVGSHVILKRQPANLTWIYGDDVSWVERMDEWMS